MAGGDRALQSRVRFTPLKVAGRWTTILLLLAGPLAWVAAFVIVAFVVERSGVVELGLLLALGSFVLSFLVLALLRVKRDREQREGWGDGGESP